MRTLLTSAAICAFFVALSWRTAHTIPWSNDLLGPVFGQITCAGVCAVIAAGQLLHIMGRLAARALNWTKATVIPRGFTLSFPWGAIILGD